MTNDIQTGAKKLKVCILWHMHQPDYRDPISGRTLLPWAWLHALKDYGEMLETVIETGARVTINLVPSLLEQLERYARGDDNDHWLDLLTRDPQNLNDAERQFIVEQFFSVNEERHIHSSARYHELYLRRNSRMGTTTDVFSDQDIRDLQVLFLLAWTGYHLRNRSVLISSLLKQGANFQEEQKRQLLYCCHDEVGRILALHRELEESGAIEISVTPYAHPILPLLCDLRIAQEPTPGLPLPTVDFRYPGDARLQVREGLKSASHFLGPRQRGMWPAEGAVSEAAVEILAQEGALWAASDEDILARSLDAGLADRRRLYGFYSFYGLPLIFRDRELSDRIGFLYAGWSKDEAVGDLLQRLRRIALLTPDGTVAIILDGENCWERYPDNGYPFLRDLYLSLLNDETLEMTTITQALQLSQPTALERLASGSWIRSDFTTWIGHPEENLAWELLAQARREVFQNEIDQALTDPDEPLSDLVRELLRAEGSDWFWWYGDEHSSAQADIFDRLFRLHLEGLYQLLGVSVPPRLQLAIKPVFASISAGFEPSTRFTPEIDGLIGDYFEWLAAGCIELSTGGAMYASREGLELMRYGYDEQYLYFRIDQADLLRRKGGKRGMFEIRLLSKNLNHLRYWTNTRIAELYDGDRLLSTAPAACDQVMELAVSLAALHLQPGDVISLSCHIYRDGRENGRWPTEGRASFCYRGATLDEENWMV